MNENLFDDFLSICKEQYYNEVIPALAIKLKDDNFHLIKTTYYQIVKKFGLTKFSELLCEGTYLTQLWTAHLLIEENNLPLELKKKCLSIIKDYIDNPLVSVDLSREESLWLNEYNIDQ